MGVADGMRVGGVGNGWVGYDGWRVGNGDGMGMRMGAWAKSFIRITEMGIANAFDQVIVFN